MKKAKLVFALLIISNQLLAQCDGGNACRSLKITRVQGHTYVDDLDGSRKIRIDYYTAGSGFNGLGGPYYKIIEPKKGVAIEENATKITANFAGSPPPPPRPPQPTTRNEVIRTDMDLPIGAGRSASFKAGTSVTYLGNIVIQGTLRIEEELFTGAGSRLQWRGNQIVKFNSSGNVIQGMLDKDTTIPNQSNVMVLQKAGATINLDDSGRTK